LCLASSAPAPIATGWSDPVAGWESHPLKTNTFHGAHSVCPRSPPVCPRGPPIETRSVPEGSHKSWEDEGPFWARPEWEDKAVFLTEKEALKFIRANGHHLNEPRTYVKHFWRNSEMETVMRALEEFSGEKLVWR
jgi:hypothetical protein